MKTTRHLLYAVIFFTTALSFAQNGTLDNSFDSDGKVLTEFDIYNSSVNSIVVQPDGKIIAAGAAFNHEYNQFALARYNSDGTLDSDFGIGGKVISDFSTSKMALKSIALQEDGKIIGVGIIYNNFSDSQYIIVRYNSNGTLDIGFGVNGIVIGYGISLNAVLVQYDGKLIVAGFTFDDLGNREIYLARYLEEGILDPDFATDGFATTSVGDRDFGYALSQQADGKIVVTGSSYNTGYYSDFIVARYNNGGTPDSTFGTNGIALIDGQDTDEAAGIKIQTDGKILISGWSSAIDGSLPSFSLIRLLANGGRDSDFGTNGMISGAGPEMAKALEVQSDGKILMAGAVDDSGNYNISLSRYLINGNPDSTFGINGNVSTPLSTTCEANCILLQTDGRIVIGGEAGTTGGTYSPNFAVVRYNSGLELASNAFNPAKNSFLVYPNPVHEVVNLDFALDKGQILSVDLYDSIGNKIRNLINEKCFDNGHNLQELQLPSTLSNGIYYLNISNGGESTIVKLLK